jgi:phage gp16-like protein
VENYTELLAYAKARKFGDVEHLAVYAIEAKLGMDDAAYRAFLDGTCGKDSAVLMTIREMETVLRVMRKQGFKQEPCRVKPEEQGMANAAQLEYIKGMW